jgi:hypothetical protein
MFRLQPLIFCKAIEREGSGGGYREMRPVFSRESGAAHLMSDRNDDRREWRRFRRNSRPAPVSAGSAAARPFDTAERADAARMAVGWFDRLQHGARRTRIWAP